MFWVPLKTKDVAYAISCVLYVHGGAFYTNLMLWVPLKTACNESHALGSPKDGVYAISWKQKKK